MKAEFKKQIKQDEFAGGLSKGIGWVREHEREATVTAVVVLVLAASWLGFSTWSSNRSQAAEEAFAGALKTYHAPLAGEAPPEGSPKVYASAAERYRQAAQEFAEVSRRYGSQPAARRARYYEGLSRLELGQYDEAAKALGEVAAAHDGQALAPDLARLSLASLEMRRGKVDDALKLYRQMADDSGLALPRDHVLMVLSSALEEARRLPEARDTYRRLAEEFPGSVYASEARRRADFLKNVAAS
jgi:TolA-binding protein